MQKLLQMLSNKQWRNSMKLWIARDQNGDLFLYPIKPDRYVTEYYVFFNGDDWWNIDSDLFPEVTFENSPMEVELVIKK